MTVPLDALIGAIFQYENAKARIVEWETYRDAARAQIEAAMGENETGTVDGKDRVKWTTVESTRLSQAFIKDYYPEVYHKAMVSSKSRRFVLVDGE